MQLPTIPNFTSGDTSLNHLQQLSQAVSFCAIASSFPLWRFYKTAGQSLTTSGWNTLNYGTVAIDTDNVFSNPTGNGVAGINTQGYYAVEACIPFQGEASGTNNTQCSFLFTAGAANPRHSSGSTIRFGGAASAAASGTGTDWVLCMADKCPAVCYPGDFISVQVWPTIATSSSTLVNTSATAGWFPPVFSGRWVRMGS